MKMIDNELKIAQYTDGAMPPEVQSAFLAEVHADPELREVIETEQAIQGILRADAAIIEQNTVSGTTPGAPLLERLAVTKVSSNRKTIYYFLSAAILLTLLAFLLFRSEPPVQNPPASPVPTQIEPIAPIQTTPVPPENISPETHLRVKNEWGKSNTEVKNTPQKKNGIDLDQDLKGKPKVFTDPKAHMPIK